MSEGLAERRRRKFAAGVLEQAGNWLSGLSAGVFIAGVVAPVVTASLGTVNVTLTTAVATIAIALLSAAGLLTTAMWLRGLAKVRDDDASVDRLETDSSLKRPEGVD